MDDPFDQLHGPNAADPADVLPNVGILDEQYPLAGGDNSGTGWGFEPSDATDENGIASVTVTVTMQPGDNFGGAASLIQEALTQNTIYNGPNPAYDGQTVDPQEHADALSVAMVGGKFVRNGDFAAYETPLVWSPMLTVWRKLHLELAAMQRPTFPLNTWTANWNNPRVFTDGSGGQIPTRIVIDTDDLSVDNNQFEDGWISLQGSGLGGFPTYRVFESVDTWTTDNITVVLDAGIGQLNGVTTGTFIVCDDDIADQALFDAGVANPLALGSFGSDVARFGVPIGPQLPFPETQGLDLLYKPAYVLPVVGASNPGVIPFVQNLPDIFTDGYFDSYRVVRSAANPVSTAAYWTALVGTGFQSDADEDGDPDNQPYVTKGANPHGNGSTDAGNLTGIRVVFLETIDDAGGVAEVRIVAHELAHTLGVPHDPDGTGGLMVKYPAGNPAFLAHNLKRIREYVEP